MDIKSIIDTVAKWNEISQRQQRILLDQNLFFFLGILTDRWISKTPSREYILSTTFFIAKKPENVKHAITVADGSCWLSQWKDIRRKTLSRSADISFSPPPPLISLSLSLLCQVLDCWAPAISKRSQLGSLGIRLIRALHIGKEMKSIEERGTASTPTLITSFHVSAKRERNRRRRGGWAFGPPISL